MGVDLRLLPLDYLAEQVGQPPWGFSHTILQVPRDRQLWKVLAEELPVVPVPEKHNISCYTSTIPDGAREGESGYGTLDEEDAYGCPYTWCRAGDLHPFLVKFHPEHPTTAYVGALKPDNLIILDWH